MPQSFNFYDFLKDATNQSLVFLQDNPQYDDVLHALADMFDKLYMRVQELKITNAMDIDGDATFQNYLNTNDGAVDVNFILETAAKYLDTDHFKDTIALLIRQYEERRVGGEIPNLDTFIQTKIIPSYKFFTMNAGDLHKSKGVKSLIERIFEFYSPTASYEKMFDGVLEYDDADLQGRRLEQFTSYRIGISEDILRNNYPDLGELEIHDFIELNTHKYALATGYVFTSRKDRDDWWIIDSGCNAIYKIDEHYIAFKQGSTLSFYSDAFVLYDESFEYVTPTPKTTYENVLYVPKIINVTDPLNEYHTHNLYFIERVENQDTFADYEYNLVRFQNDISRDRTFFQTVLQGMGLSYDPLTYNDRVDYPKITSYVNVDYLWLDFYDQTQTTYTFNVEDVKVVYSYVVEYQTKQPDGIGGFTYPINKMLVVARDGYDYDTSTNGFYYNLFSPVDNDTYNKYIFQERSVTPLLEEEVSKSISFDRVQTVFDMLVLGQTTVAEDYYYNFIGYWDASSDAAPLDTSLCNHGDYWIVSKFGDYELNGITGWQIDDVVVWNGNFNYWQKNNNIPTLLDADKTYYRIDRTLIALNSPQFDYVDSDDSSITTPYEESGGMFNIKISEIPLEIQGYGDVYSIDSNAIETFGKDPNVLFTYKSSRDKRLKILSVKMDRFASEVDIADLSRILRGYPYPNSKTGIYNVQFSDKHILVYGRDNRHSALGTFAIILENTAYNLPLGIRNNDMNIQYDIDVRDLTRANQPYYRVEDSDGNIIDDEEVAAFQATLERYTPINTESETLAVRVDMGYTNQLISSESTPETISVEMPLLGVTKTLKEQSNFKAVDSLILRIDGNPDDVNCDCDEQREILYVYDFEAMTIFYNLDDLLIDPNIINLPSKIEMTKIGAANDQYSKYQDVCRWESDWFEYGYLNDTTIPTTVRTKIRINLYSEFQQFVPWGSNDNLRYNWGIHFLVEFFNEGASSETISSNPATDSVLLLNGNGESTGNHSITSLNTIMSPGVYGDDDSYAYFNGTTNYGFVTGNVSDWDLASNDFTLESQVRFDSVSGVNRPIIFHGTNGVENGFLLTLVNGNELAFYIGPMLKVLSYSWTPVIGTWYHIAVNRIGSDFVLYIDGVQVNTGSSAHPFVHDTVGLFIGLSEGVTSDKWDAATIYYFHGGLQDIRLTNGEGVYPTAFTPPTTSLTVDTNTVVLVPFDGDKSSSNHTLYFSAATYSNTGKYNNSIGLLSYGTNYMWVDGSTDFEFGTGAFTLESWVYLESIGVDKCIMNSSLDSSNYWSLEINTDNTIHWHVKKAGIEVSRFSTTSPVINAIQTWYHVALVVESDGTSHIFIDGVDQSLSITTAHTDMPTGMTYVRIGHDSGTRYLNGYIDDCRISKGISRYTTDFTPPEELVTTLVPGEETQSSWVTAIDEEIYKPVVMYDECNPIGQFYTTSLIDDGSTFPMIPVEPGSTYDDGSTFPMIPAEAQDPWDVYNIPAAKISLI